MNITVMANYLDMVSGEYTTRPVFLTGEWLVKNIDSKTEVWFKCEYKVVSATFKYPRTFGIPNIFGKYKYTEEETEYVVWLESDQLQVIVTYKNECGK